MRRSFVLNAYKAHCACFVCRKTFKIHWLKRVKWTNSRIKKRLVPLMSHHFYELPPTAPRVCPQCGGELHEMPLTFKSPPQRDIKAWQLVEEDYWKQHPRK